MYAARKYHTCIFENNDVQLFDLQNDPHETHNLATDRETNGELLLAMNARMNQLIREEIGEDSGEEVKVCLRKLAGK